jgi:tRNA(Ile)-lysidine synthase TilS/MesJ
MSMVLFTLTELATWNCKHEELVGRRNLPWDSPEHRLSHENRRNFLRHAKLEVE